ncbi:hypothetical protein FJK98_02490 [Micromonospora sp. HM134]|uniref:hypothetical protein n=1 Tax=Micromonospora sp. HM134 TaxID=2583243 RepID=UPI001198C7DE|nr:hypothetical protein [Micromonospora sp. HM134]QDY06170.1 hypothetical protein FJK98_02490 [Micromonospora sp. HM134]
MSDTSQFDAILAQAKLPERTVPLCLREDLVAEYERLDNELLGAPRTASSLGEVAPATVIARRMEELRKEMLAHQVQFLLRAWPARRFTVLRDAMPKKADDQSDDEFADVWHAAVCDLVSKMLVEPKATAEQVAELADRLAESQWLALSNAAWDINARGQAIPFSVAASAILGSAETK